MVAEVSATAADCSLVTVAASFADIRSSPATSPRTDEVDLSRPRKPLSRFSVDFSSPSRWRDWSSSRSANSAKPRPASTASTAAVMPTASACAAAADAPASSGATKRFSSLVQHGQRPVDRRLGQHDVIVRGPLADRGGVPRRP